MRLSTDDPYFEQIEAEGSHPVQGTVQSRLVEMLSTKRGKPGAHDHIEVLESVDDGGHGFAFESDLVCPGCHLPFIICKSLTDL